jgi:hypothetical protein
MVCAAVACLPTAVSLLLLEALFMQISGVSLTLTWPRRLCLLRVLCTMPLLQAFPFPSTLGEVTVHLLSLACLFVYSSHGKWVFPPPHCSFYKLSHSWLLGTRPRSHPLLSSQAQLVYLQFWEGFPSPPLQCSGCPTLFATCLYCCYCLLLSFSFFPRWGSVCPGGYAVLAQGCLWEYHVPLSSPCPCLPKPSGCRCLVAARGPSWFLHLT